jgi:hypothetical protein
MIVQYRCNNGEKRIVREAGMIMGAKMRRGKSGQWMTIEELLHVPNCPKFYSKVFMMNSKRNNLCESIWRVAINRAAGGFYMVSM